MFAAGVIPAPGGWGPWDTMVVVLANMSLLAGAAAWALRQLHRAQHQTDTLVQRLLETVARVEDEWRYQHTQGTYVGTLEGLWKVQREANRMRSDDDPFGGLSPVLRDQMDAAAEEMFRLYRAETGRPERGLVRLWEEAPR